MNLEDIMLGEINCTETKKQILYDLSYMWNQKEKKKAKPIETESRMVSRWLAGG